MIALPITLRIVTAVNLSMHTFFLCSCISSIFLLSLCSVALVVMGIELIVVVNVSVLLSVVILVVINLGPLSLYLPVSCV